MSAHQGTGIEIQSRPDEKVLDVLLAEYRQIRAEIDLKQGHTHTITNFAVVITLGAFGMLGTSDALGPYQLYGMLLVPLLLGNLGLLFAYETSHIVVASGYIHDTIRSRVRRLLKEDQAAEFESGVMSWEHYKRAHSPAAILQVLFDLARWLMFVFPSVILLAGYWVNAPPRGIIAGKTLFTMGVIANGLVLFLFIHRWLYKLKVLFVAPVDRASN